MQEYPKLEIKRISIFTMSLANRWCKTQFSRMFIDQSGLIWQIHNFQNERYLAKYGNENENDRKRKIGLVVGARKGDVIEYFETDKNKEGYSLNSQDISINKCKIMLWKAIKDILEIAGYDIAGLKRELFGNTISHMAMPSRGVTGSMTSYTTFLSGMNQVANNYNEKGGEL